MKYVITNIQKIETIQKRWNKFKNTIIKDFVQNKDEIKGTKLENELTITGIGEKCLKIENNFISWEDICNIAIEEDKTDDKILKAVINYIFEDSPFETTEKYEAKKFSRKEAIQNFNKIKEEIIQNKEYYKKGEIVGIGEKAVAYTYDGYYNEYIKWDDIKDVIKKMSVQDYATFKPSSFMTYTLQSFFYDDEEEETQVEKKVREKGEKYAEEKAYIYRHIILGDLAVDQIRSLVYCRHNHHANSNEREEIINELMQFAFKYAKEVKYTNKQSDEGDLTKLTNEYCSVETANKYAVREGKSYSYIIKNKKISEEANGYVFEDYKKVVFKLQDTIIEVYRNGKKVHGQVAGKKPVYVRVRDGNPGEAYELGVQQQLLMMQEQGIIRKVSEDEIREYFLDFIKNNESEMADEVREAIGDKINNIEKVYGKSKAIQHYAREMYKVHHVRGNKFYQMLNAIMLEDKVNTDLILDYVLWDDSSFARATVYEDRYNFLEEAEKYGSKKITLDAGLDSKTYSYMQNCEYTQIEYVEAYIDTFAVATVYLSGDVSEDDAIRLFEYRDGLADVDMKYGYIYEKDGIITRF